MVTPVKTEIEQLVPVEHSNDGVEVSDFTRVEFETPLTFGHGSYASGYQNMVGYLETVSGLRPSGDHHQQESSVVMIADKDTVVLAMSHNAHNNGPKNPTVYEFTGSKGEYSLISKGRLDAGAQFAAGPDSTVMFGWVSKVPGADPAGERKSDGPMHETYRSLMDAAERGQKQRIGRRILRFSHR